MSGGVRSTKRGVGRDGKKAPCEVWGVLNVTPDSFSDGGLHLDREAAVRHGARMLADGADVVDVGGESSRPAGRTYGAGAVPVSLEEELARVVPVVERLVGEHGVRVSVDTVKPAVARAALGAGASILNDVSGGRSPELLGVVAEAGAELVLMHNRGRGQVDVAHTGYHDVVGDVLEELLEAVDRAVSAGVPPGRVWIDPGIGFAKTAAQSLELLARLGALVATGHPVLVGTSRKSFIAELAPAPDGSLPEPLDRAGGTAATVALAVMAGARAVRVHDVMPMRQAVRLAEAVASGRAA